MIVNVNINIQNEPGDSQYYGGSGSLQFAESTQFSGAGFETVSKIFTRCHDLLAVLKQEHAISAEGTKRR